MDRTSQVVSGTAEHGVTLSVVVVNYNSWPDVERLVECLTTSQAFREGACELIVVDNASREPMPRSLERQANIQVLPRLENGGFATGVNDGWRAAHGRWILLLNPDVVIGSSVPDRVIERIATYEIRPEGPPGVVGFALRDPDGSRQPSVGVEPSLLRSLSGLFLPRRRRKYQPGSRVNAGPVPWVTGALALIDARLLSELGGLDEDFFLYYEEVALCRRARGLGRSVEFDPSIEAVHLHPLQNRTVSLPFRVITRHSKLLYFRKHRPPWEFRTLARIVILEAWCRRELARFRRREREFRAWDAILGFARRLRKRDEIPAGEVRDMAESLLITNSDHFSPRPGSLGMGRRRTRTRSRTSGIHEARP